MIEIDSSTTTDDRTQHIKNVLSRITFCDHLGEAWTFKVDTFTNSVAHYIQACFYALDVETGTKEQQRGRKWYISDFATDSEIVFTCLAAVKMALQHEMHESFLVDGHRLVDPHVDAFELAARVFSQDARQHLEV